MNDKKIAVLGLGYVGLPLALGLSFSYNIKGFDVDNIRINQLRKGIDSTLEVDEKKLLTQQKKKKIFITSNKKELNDCNIFIATVPTPIDKKKRPDFSSLLKVCKIIGGLLKKNDIVVCISQSGETADTLAALKIAKEKGAFIYGICNVVGSSISRATHSGMYTHAGPEIGVASTKAFSSQITVLILLALKLAELKNTIDPETSKAYQKELSEIPSLIEAVIKNNSTIKTIAEKYADSTNCIYMGRGYNFPVALEGALKLKEISYIHAEGYPAAEMKHGPIALIDKNMPVVVIATKKTNYDKIVSNIQEIKSREGKIIAIVSEGDKTIAKLANDVIEIPDVSEFFTPIIAAIPLQLLSYYIAIIRGCNVDQPRNLAKSVTVE